MFCWKGDAQSRLWEDEFDQDLFLNLWHGLKKLVWQDELNPRVRCAFGNVYYKHIKFDMIAFLFFSGKGQNYFFTFCFCTFLSYALPNFVLITKLHPDIFCCLMKPFDLNLVTNISWSENHKPLIFWISWQIFW